MRVAVIGAGAMGSLVSYLLHAGGMEVVLYESREKREAEIRANGVRLRGAVAGRESLGVRSPGESASPFDFIILAVAAGAGGDALRPLSPFVHRDTLYLSLQEGSAVEELAQLVGDSRVGGAVALASAMETSTGEVEVEEFRSLVMGGFIPEGSPGFSPLVEAVNAVCPGKALLTTGLDKEIWRRLEAAAAVSGLCAVLGAVPEEIKGRDEVDALCREAAEECRRAAASTGPETFPPGSPWEDAVWRCLKPPMLRDLEAARGTEVEYLSGYIVGRSRARGRSAPVHSAMCSLVKEMESGRRRPGEGSLKELQRRVREERGMALQ